MQIRSLSASLRKSGANCLTIFVSNDGHLLFDGEELDAELNGRLSAVANSELLGNDAGNSIIVPIAAENLGSVLLYRLGNKAIPADKYQAAIKKLAATLIATKSKSIAIELSSYLVEASSATELVSDLSSEIHYQNYRFENYKSKKKPALTLENIQIGHADAEDAEDAVQKGLALAEGIEVTRDLGNMPGNDCTPTYLAERAESLAKSLDINVEILDEEQMRELGMGSLLSVSAGSVEPAKLIIMKYQGASEGEQPHVLVGKGITFDTGGISLKPGGGMDEMKYDMCGAASVFGAMVTASKMKLPVNLVCIVAAAENMPSGIATKPGDIVTSMSGKTIEVLNTDAEGRLVLCDALTYAERFNPQSMIDIATLTGAVIVALGRQASGMYANDDELAQALAAAGQKTGDRVWRMPLWKEYAQQLDSPFADIANIGGRDAGSVTAACFLAKFTEKQKWAHLDVAGTAWKSGKAKGATGRPVKLLVEYLKSVAA